MKHLLLFITILYFSVSTVYSQISYGVKAGLNISKLKGGFDYKNKAGLHIGGFAEFDILEKFVFQSELLFSTQGGKFEYEKNTEGYKELELKTNINYINLHLSAKYYVTNNVYVKAGPQIGFLMSAKDIWKGILDNNDDYNLNQDVKKDYKKIDFGLNLGLGYKTDMGVFFDVRYNFGMLNVSSVSIANQELILKNNIFQFSIGYIIK